jgi:hypothetical protein
MNRQLLKKLLQLAISVLALAWILIGYDCYLSGGLGAVEREPDSIECR